MKCYEPNCGNECACECEHPLPLSGYKAMTLEINYWIMVKQEIEVFNQQVAERG